MATAVLSSPAFTLGEVAPALFGRFDTARIHTALSTCRNMWPSYRGGVYSRAGTSFVGFSKQTGRTVPPRLIPFQFNVEQGLVLEFGHYYMRVVADGAFVTEDPFQITNITQTSPAVVTYQSLSTALSVTANNGAVSASYVRGDTVTLAGGVFVTPAVLRVNTTTVARLVLGLGGAGYTAGDTVTLNAAGAATNNPPILTVLTVGGGGAIVTVAISNGGIFTTNGTGNFTQAATSGSGSGATFVNGLFGPAALSVVTDGGYTTLPANPVNQASTSGLGAGATYTVIWSTPNPLANEDWVFLSGVQGMTQVNNQTYILRNLTPTTFELYDVHNSPIDATGFPAYTGGGLAAAVYTLSTPYAEEDLNWIKFTESADVMSLCCVNQDTNIEYPPYDLRRAANDDWSFTQMIPATGPSAPQAVSGSASSAGTVQYAYVVTAISPDDGTESIASARADVATAVNIAATAGTITITYIPIAGVNEYNIYKATPGIGATSLIPAGALFGYAGSAYGGQFLDSNIIPDFSQVPPTHQDPFARGRILGISITNIGAGASFTITVNSLTGSGAVFETVVVNSTLIGVIVKNAGRNYLPTDTVTITNGATGTLMVGPQSGTYPSVPAYTQQRRVYANTLNNPDTYFMSSPGAFTNFDFRIPTIPSDAITGTPWAVQVNGIQFMLNMPGGLIVFTGLDAWQLSGEGGSSLTPTPLTPASQQAQPQTSNGCSATVSPVKIEADIIYLTAAGAFYYSFEYLISGNIYTGNDLTTNSTHLFTGHTIKQHAWCQQPYRLLWAIRDDGILLSLTRLKSEKVDGWARHDTDGSWESVCAVKEPPTDALYLAAQRRFGVNESYIIERMDDRLWSQTENCWCVDCGFSLAQPQPAAILRVSSATGLGALTGITNLVTGAGYSAATVFSVVDDNGKGVGAGAVPTVTLDGNGAVTAVLFNPGDRGADYTFPKLIANDPEGTGSGFSCDITLDNTAAFSASAAVFAVGNIGDVIRVGGGIAEITAYTDALTVTANILAPIVRVDVNAAGEVRPRPAAPGEWSMTTPISSVFVPQLAGATVTGLADGNVIAPQVVPANGVLPLGRLASAVIVGLGFQAQAQSVYLDTGEPTAQGQRKKIPAVTARLQASRGIEIGSNQIDGSILSPSQIAPQWNYLVPAPDKAQKPYNALCESLYTGDVRIPVKGGFATPGQVAVQQRNPLPMEILAFIPEVLGGDKPEQAVSQENRKGAAGVFS